ncbi:hypothetical protein [Rhizobium sp. AN73]|uniref:hypothetical protein n=1 Tax=Rhizobium sp. AN73 TaxID=3035124 RepID=UPI0027413237|nr:hypothetical protein [Rhizobium sp. AN73]
MAARIFEIIQFARQIGEAGGDFRHLGGALVCGFLLLQKICLYRAATFLAGIERGAQFADLQRQLLDFQQKAAVLFAEAIGIAGSGLVGEAKRGVFFPFGIQFLADLGVFGGIKGARHVLLGADFLRADGHCRAQTVFRIGNDAAMDRGRDQQGQQGCGEKTQSEKNGIFNHARQSPKLRYARIRKEGRESTLRYYCNRWEGCHQGNCGGGR